jgi:hypothetical protein
LTSNKSLFAAAPPDGGGVGVALDGAFGKGMVFPSG